MDQPYSLWADGLSKFQTASIIIQGLWIVSVTAVVLAVLHTIRAIIVAALQRAPASDIELLYAVARDRAGRLLTYPDLPRELEKLTDETEGEARPIVEKLQNWRDKIR